MNDRTATPPTTDPIAAFKQKQREAWANFAPLAMLTTIPAARLVRFAGVRPGQRVLDAGCGTGVVAITAAMHAGAKVTGLDLTPELLAVARENAQIGNCEIDWHEGDVEKLPFKDAEFDIVLSQFGHMFAPRPDVAIAEMLRVLKPGGTIAFSTWPPELFNGRMFAVVSRYLPPPPPGASPSPLWGDPTIVRERLGDAVTGLTFERDIMIVPTLSPQHHRTFAEKSAGPLRAAVERLATTDPAKLAELRQGYDEIASEIFEGNSMRQGYLMTRAVKK